MENCRDAFLALERALTGAGIIMLDRDGSITGWNAGAERLTGFRENEVLGSQFARFYLAEDVGKGTPARDLKAAAAEGRFTRETWLVRRNASRYYASLCIVALGQGFCVLITDQTRQKRDHDERERLLREVDSQRRLFQSVMEHAPAAITILDGRSLRIRWANPEFLRIVEAQAWGGDVNGVRLEELLPGVAESGLAALAREAAARSEPRVHAEYELRETTYWRAALVPLGDASGAPEVMLLMTDITQQVNARKKISREQRFLAMILDTIPVSVTYLDSNLIYRQCNTAAARDLGRGASEILGRRLREVIPGSPEVCAAVEDVLRTGQPYSKPVITMRLPELEGERHFRVAYLPDKDERGSTVGVFTMRLDVTELLETKRRLEEANAELALRNREVERANRLKSEFVASMSHELRTPLTSILGFSELLDEQDLTPKQHRQVRHVLEGARHLLAIISDILDLSKIEAGRLDLHKEAFALDGAVSNVLDTLAPQAASKQLKIVNGTGAGVTVYADRVRLTQILFNLLSNAVKFTPEGGRIGITAAERNGRVEVSVTDTGIGIAEEELGDIFKAFHQAGTAASGVREGTGLGLTITRHLVEMHGGEIRARSGVGEGSEFTFTIPLHDVAASPAAPPLRRERLLALVVDDEPAARELLVSYLGAAGFETATAASAEEALRRARELAPDVITLDALLPGKSGWQTLHELKTSAATAAIPVVIVSIVDEKKMGLALGAAEYLVKPVSREALLAAVASVTTCERS